MNKSASATMNRNGNDKSIVITGTSTGIGRACAIHLDRLGFKVFAGVRKKEDGEILKSVSSDRMTPVLLDVTDETSISDAFKIVEERTGDGLHGLVNNAGISLGGPLELVPVSDIQKVFDVNVVGMMAVTKQFIPLIRKAGGRVVNIGSAYGFFAVPGQSSYVASKHAAEGLTDSLRLEFSLFNIPVSIVEPGVVETEIWGKSAETHEDRCNFKDKDILELYFPLLESAKKYIHQRKGVQPVEVAKAVEHALTSKKPKHRYAVGSDAKMASLMKRFIPARMMDYLVMERIKKQ
ncbi:MAG: SDR family oxidoreductase [Desulfobacteraceae bacterium]|nr:SDR family oxidoreductase [Desulfobacteraceae bacterium]